ncbi:MAG: type II toxin-antitoxin system RelE/ParE family toxin [Actinomycetota bacterium]
MAAATVAGMQRLHLVPARRWRHYATPGGRRPTFDYLTSLPTGERHLVAAEMRRVAVVGLTEARHLRGEIYEVRARGALEHRILFAREGQHRQILLALCAFTKKTQRTPLRELDLAERRLHDWRGRAPL